MTLLLFNSSTSTVSYFVDVYGYVNEKNVNVNIYGLRKIVLPSKVGISGAVDSLFWVTPQNKAGYNH